MLFIFYCLTHAQLKCEWHPLFLFCAAGRYDLHDSAAKCLYCGCLTEQSLIHSYITRGCWPGCPTRKGRYIYMETLFELYDTLQKHMPGLSESGFIQSLESLSETRGRVSWRGCNCSLTCFVIYNVVTVLGGVYQFIRIQQSIWWMAVL